MVAKRLRCYKQRGPQAVIISGIGGTSPGGEVIIVKARDSHAETRCVVGGGGGEGDGVHESEIS